MEKNWQDNRSKFLDLLKKNYTLIYPETMPDSIRIKELNADMSVHLEEIHITFQYKNEVEKCGECKSEITTIDAEAIYCEKHTIEICENCYQEKHKTCDEETI